MEFIALAGWVGSGVAASCWVAPPGPSRWAWAPIAAVLGPFWAPVALDQRDLHATEMSEDLSDAAEPPAGLPVGFAESWTHPEHFPRS